MKDRNLQQDVEAVCRALLRSSDFHELGFSARRPLGTQSYVPGDVRECLDLEQTDENTEYAEHVWEQVRLRFPAFVDELLAKTS